MLNHIMVECIVNLKGASKKEECSSKKTYFQGLGEDGEKENQERII